MLILYRNKILWITAWIWKNQLHSLLNFTTTPIVLFFLFELQIPLVPKALQEDWQEWMFLSFLYRQYVLRHTNRFTEIAWKTPGMVLLWFKSIELCSTFCCCFMLLFSAPVYVGKIRLYFTSLRRIHKKETSLRVSFSVHHNSKQRGFMIVFKKVVLFCH